MAFTTDAYGDHTRLLARLELAARDGNCHNAEALAILADLRDDTAEDES